MAIEYPGGTVVKTTLDGTVNTNFLSDLNAAMVSAGWTSTPAGGSNYNLVSAKTPDGLQMEVRIATSSGTYASISAYDMDGNGIGGQEMYIGAGTVFECLVTRYTLWVWITGITSALPVGAVTGYASAMCTGIPFLPDPVKPLTVNGATNASPIQITTVEDHLLTTGESVYIQGVLGNTAANGSHVITSTGAKTFTLNGSTGSGTYTSGGVVGSTLRLSRCIYINGSDGTGALDVNGWRRDPFRTISTSGITSYSGVALNGYSIFSNSLVSPLVQPSTFPWRNSRLVIVEPYISALSATQAQVYGAVVLRGSPTPSIDTLFTMDGHSWLVFGVGGSANDTALAIAVN